MNQEETLIRYFLDNRTEAGLVLDRESDRNTVSVAATGFGMTCWAIAYQKGYLSRQQAVDYISQAIDTTVKNSFHGWFYHFTDASGLPKKQSEISTIDSAIFYWGARKAASIFGELIDKVESLISGVDLDMVMNDNYFYHGIRDDKLIEFVWDEYNEGVLIYRLFDKPFLPKKTNYNLPLFVYYYPLCFLDETELVDKLKLAIQYQIDNYGYWGVTATDGPNGYEAGNPEIISPLAIWSVSKYVDFDFNSIPVSRETCSYCMRSAWHSTDKLGIDYGACLCLL